jgi:very-short-patch-repair endonuclease
MNDKILDIIKKSNGIKAKDIANRLGATTSEVNSCLYGQLRGKVQQDAAYKWYVINSVQTSNNTATQEQPDIDLHNICKYYLNCLSVDDTDKKYKVETWARGQFGVNYAELSTIDFNDIESNDTIRRLAGIVIKTPSMLPKFGYPTLLKRFSTKNGVNYTVIPILLYQAEFQNGLLKQIDTTPRINPEIINLLSNGDSNDSIYELIDLENELGLNNLDADIEIADIVQRLVSIRPHWVWKETIDADKLNITDSLSVLENPGIYNKAILIVSERSPFTQGLETELNQLANLSESAYKGTALHSWVHPELSASENTHNSEIIEVLPLNTEQEQAVKLALNAQLSIVTGPPGTGKSQVVTDLLVNAAWQNKSVLFASKNNKAVDVVESRVNGLGKRPILLRLGSNSSNRLPEMVQELLSITVTQQDRMEYENIYKEYSTKTEQIKVLNERKNKIIVLRNRLDALEKSVEEYRKEADNLWQKPVADKIDEISSKLSILEKTFERTINDKQSFVVRICWFLLSSQRNKAYQKNATQFNSFLNDLDVSLLPTDITKSNPQNIQSIITLTKRKINAINHLVEYKRLLEDVNQSETITELDKTLFTLKKDISEIANELWKKWLICKTKTVAATDRLAMTRLLAQIKLAEDKAGSKLLSQLSTSISKYLPCWAVTSLSAKGRIPFTAGIYDLLVIDEASQCDIASVLPLLFRAKRALIIGDPKQLNHITTLSKKQDVNLLRKYNVSEEWSYKEMSLFDLANGLVNPENKVQLRDHHRCHSDIITFSDKEFYNNTLRVATKYSKLKTPANLEAGIRWIQIDGRTERPFNGSAINKIEADKIIAELSHLVIDNDYQGSVGIVTPFRAQADYIRDKIAHNTSLQNRLQTQNEFLVETVHKFQGDERDIMFFSSVVSAGISDGSLGFLSSTGNLFNVAITRARAVLIVVGNRNFCLNCNVSYLKNFASYAIELENKQTIITNPVYPESRKYPIVDNPEQVSDWEKEFYTCLYDAGIVTIPQYKVEKYRLDLALFDDKRQLDIEIDGEAYHKDWTGELCYRDQLRNHRLYELGWDVLRFWVYQIRDEPQWCIEQIRKWKNKQ